MATIKFKSELPTWFLKKNRYSWLNKDTPIQHVADQLAIRVAAEHDIKAGKLDSEHLRDIYENKNAFSPCIAYGDSSPYHGEVIWPLSAGDVLLNARDICETNPDPFTVENLEIYRWSDSAINIYMAIEHATDAEILAELKRLLPGIRTKLGIVEPQKRNMGPRISKLKTGGIFECLDLSLWEMATGDTILGKVYSQVIKNQRYNEKRISDLKNEALEMLELRFTDQLNAEVNKKR